MIATVIPYFLLCNITAEPAWPNGPEYVYVVHGNMSAQWNESTSSMLDYDMTIRCRLKNEMTISCLSGQVSTSVETHGKWKNRTIFDSLRFDVTFNELGAERVTVPHDMDAAGKSFVGYFALQFTVGADLTGKTDLDGVFLVTNSLMYRHKINVAISYPPNTEYSKAENLYELKILPATNKPSDKAIEITKEKHGDADVDQRTIVIPYLPPKNRTMTIHTRVDEASNRMKISNNIFESYGHEKGTISWVEMGYKLIYDGHVGMMLTDIVPAGQTMPEISDPQIFSVLEQDHMTRYLTV